jgi:putative ABC transport system substrate-binding protein
MRRRDFIKVVAGSAIVWPLATRAQRRAIPVIGFLRSTSPEGTEHLLAAFREGLKETGFLEGQNFRSNTAGRMVISIGYPLWQPIWFTER